MSQKRKPALQMFQPESDQPSTPLPSLEDVCTCEIATPSLSSQTSDPSYYVHTGELSTEKKLGTTFQIGLNVPSAESKLKTVVQTSPQKTREPNLLWEMTQWGYMTHRAEQWMEECRVRLEQAEQEKPGKVPPGSQYHLVYIPAVGSPICETYDRAPQLMRGLQKRVREAYRDLSESLSTFLVFRGLRGVVFLDEDLEQGVVQVNGRMYRPQVDSVDDLTPLVDGRLPEEKTEGSDDLSDGFLGQSGLGGF